ncbi:hypothetical protein SAMN05216456_0391 [Devosia crocina]|uniref:Uncharacterized protein n=1 Tax=Devosia crocina TaxID=429728 RepID=A0A1I7MZR6_9HYPH|nr:hypothetical protein [Devosia crocina]SFV27909.1 hypothetical protein SAMN05216456_0391 [Devosia crocina]
MSFREGLLQARGQIAFTAALIVSTAAIIYLEGIDTTARIREQVVADIAVTGSAGQPDVRSRSALEAAVDSGRTVYEANPQVPFAQAAALNAAVLGVSQGIGVVAEHHRLVDEIIGTLETSGADAAIHPALGLVAAAMPQFETRISPLLASN